MRAREEMWAAFMLVSLERGKVVTKRSFAAIHGIDAGEFGRWLSTAGKRWVASGCSTDLRARAELAKAIGQLESVPRPRSMEDLRGSQPFTTRPQ
jgi:hypothetical protein